MNIQIRPIDMSDLKIMNKWKNDEEIFKYLGEGYNPITIEEHKKWFHKLTDNSTNNKRFIIEIEKKAIGFIGLYNIDETNETCSLGLYIGEKEEWGKGYATKAYLLVEEMAKKSFNIRKITLNVVQENIGAVKLYQKIGFRICGNMKKERYIDGEYKDILIMEKFL